MLRSDDPSLRALALLGLRVLALTGVIGGAAALAFLHLRPERGLEGMPPVAPRVAAPTLLPPVVEPAPPAPPTPRAPGAIRSAAWLRDLGVPPPARRRDAAAVPAAALCSKLGEAGWAMSGWSEGALGGAARECIGERPFPSAAGSTENEATNAFVILRGTPDGALRELRVKMNVLDAATAADASTELVRLLEQVYAELRWPLPPEVAEALRDRRNVTADDAGTVLRFWREAGQVPRYNLRLAVPAPLAPADRFEFTAGEAADETPAPAEAPLP